MEPESSLGSAGSPLLEQERLGPSDGPHWTTREGEPVGSCPPRLPEGRSQQKAEGGLQLAAQPLAYAGEEESTRETLSSESPRVFKTEGLCFHISETESAEPLSRAHSSLPVPHAPCPTCPQSLTLQQDVQAESPSELLLAFELLQAF